MRLARTRTPAAALALALMAGFAAPPSSAQDKKDAKKVAFTPEIKPAPLKEDREERALPGAVTDACVGGGGRFIILTLAGERKIAIFDVNEAKVVKYVSVEDDNPSVAASLDKLIVAGGTKVDRYSLETFEKEGGITLPAGQASPVLLMGSATRGPLVAMVDSVPGLLDPNTLKATKAAGIDIPKRDKWNEKATRISADGRTVTTWNPGSSPQGHEVWTRTAGVYKRLNPNPDNKEVHGHFAPGADSRYYYSAVGLLNTAGKAVGKVGAYGDGSKYSLPAAEGEGFFLRIDVPGFPHGDKKKTGKVFLHTPGDDRPLSELADVVPPADLSYWGRGKYPIDKHFFLVPSAQLLVALPETLDKLILHKIDLDKILATTAFDYLVVASRPPREAIIGTTFSYEPVVKSKQGGVKMKLEVGSKSMKFEDGKLTWAVPVGTTLKEVDVSINITDAGGREVFHSFKIEVRPK